MRVLIFVTQLLRLVYFALFDFALEDLSLPGFESLAIVLFGLVVQRCFGFAVNVHQHKRVFDKLVFDEGVKWRVCGEAGSMVDFEHKRLEILSDEHVKAQDMEAHIARIFLRLAVSVLVTHQRGVCEQSLDDCLVDFTLKLCYVLTLPLEKLVNGSQRTLVPRRHVVDRLVEHELRIELVDRIVGEVDERLVQVGRIRLYIGFRCETRKSLFEQVHT